MPYCGKITKKEECPKMVDYIEDDLCYCADCFEHEPKPPTPENLRSTPAPCSATGVCRLVKKKLKSLRERLVIAEATNDHLQAIQLEAQIFILETMWPEFLKFE